MIYLLRLLDRRRFKSSLALAHATGPYLPLVPDDVALLDLQRSRALTAIPAVAGLLRSRRFDLCFSMVSMNLAAVIAREGGRARVPLILGARNHYSLSMPSEASLSGVKSAAVRALYPRAERIICVSEGVRRDLAQTFGIPAAKLQTIHNPIDVDRVRSLAAAPLDDPWLAEASEIPVAVAVGKLMEAKGYPDLLAAFRIVRDRVRIRLIILGDGPLRGILEQRVSRLGLTHDVRMIGFQENPYAYLARATVMMHAALWEGFPNVLVEGMACGVPVVTTDCPSGPAEIFTNGRDGFLVPVHDVQGLADATSGLVTNAPLRRSVAAAAAQRVRDFDARVVVAKYADAFEEVAANYLERLPF
jgi:glycosyltransferase involved in cell wall biosynthesis